MMSVFKVRDAFLALTYEQQAMIVDDWMERTPIATAMAPSAPKVAAIPTARNRKTHTRRLFDPAHVAKICELAKSGLTASEIGRFMSKHYQGVRTHKAWELRAGEEIKQLKAKGEIK